MFKRKPILVAIILAAVMLVGLAGCTQADVQALQGTLKNMDSVSGMVTVTMKDGTTQTFNFNDVKVDTIRQALGGTSLEIGDQVTVKVHKNGKVEELDAENAEVHGVVKEASTNSLTLTTKKDGDVTLSITPDTKIKIDDKGTATTADLKVGHQAEAKYNVNSKNALRVNVDAGEDPGQAQGTVKEVNTGNNTITITTAKNGDITLNVTPNTIIRVEDKGPAILSGLKTGEKIEAKYDVGTKNALKLNVETGEKANNGKDD